MSSPHPSHRPRSTVNGLRGAAGGFLMGLANLVPGISGGTMLLAAGIYPQFIAGVAEVTTFRFRPRTIAFLGIVVVAALVAIGALAKPVSFLVTNHRWAMYSLFIGLTLGGVPILWRLLRPMDARAWIAAAAGIAAMIGLTLWERAGAGAVSSDDGHAYLILVIAGIAGGSAMILPGVSGAYLLLVLGQYLVILGAISEAVDAVRARAWSDVLPAMHVFVPVGIGVVIGVVGVSNLLKYLLARHQRLTLGVLLGFLLGAVVGLWPFQAPSPPAIGDAVKGVVLATQADVDLVDPEDWPARFFTPNAIQVAGAAGCIIAGFLISLGTSRLGGRDPGGPAA